MLFLSGLIKNKVLDRSGQKVGFVEDIIIKDRGNLKHPAVFGLVIKSGKHKRKLVKNTDIRGYGRRVVALKKDFSRCALPVPKNDKETVFLKSEVLDKQIVDLNGVRVVRVNDLNFDFIQDVMSLVAIDIGQIGLLRRLGLSWLNFAARSEFLEWKDMRLFGDKIQLADNVKDLTKLHPADLANIIEQMNLNQGSLLLESMDSQTAARVLEEIEPEIQKILVEKLGPERASAVLQKMSVDELVDLMQLLPDRKTEQFMDLLPADDKKSSVKKILEYEEDTAGGLMNTEYIYAYPKMTVAEVAEEIKRVNHLHSSIYFVYVIDENGRFEGVVSIRKILLAGKKEKVGDLMKKASTIPTAKVDDELLEVASLITKYNLYSAAVLDDVGRLLGVVTVDDIMRHFVPHA